MQIVTEGSAFPGLQVCALIFWFKAKGTQNRRKRTTRVNMWGLPNQSLCCMYMDARRKEKFAAGEIFCSQDGDQFSISLVGCAQSETPPDGNPQTFGLVICRARWIFRVPLCYAVLIFISIVRSFLFSEAVLRSSSSITQLTSPPIKMANPVM